MGSSFIKFNKDWFRCSNDTQREYGEVKRLLFFIFQNKECRLKVRRGIK
jgi:hypothetical protein